MKKYIVMISMAVSACTYGDNTPQPDGAVNACFSELGRLQKELDYAEEDLRACRKDPPDCPECPVCEDCQLCAENPEEIEQCFSDDYCAPDMYCFYTGWQVWPFGVCARDFP